ncbi:MAG: glycoside hydrolase family 43 protein [Lachnospiraceae bacterium]|nr:glycoside hydrolase family 43 protein [Lachnospiraceae bacterium]
MKYTNPIISGMNPDPSVCRVGKDFYLVTSTFEYFPGLPLYHSTDLVHWEQIGHVLTKESQLKLPLGNPNCIGIYAPALRYHEGKFYCVVTNVGGNPGDNFFVTTEDIYGEWSDPVYLDLEGIDPSLFFDEDGRCYYTGTDAGIYICEIDKTTGKRLGEKHYECWNGTGANNPEGPHLYKKNGWYYLLIAEGGTELCHMVTIARSREIYGPYEACPWNPVLTNSRTGLPVKAAGHADFVEDTNGNWWAVCLGNRPIAYPFRHVMGRETMLVPVTWENDWPRMGVDGHVPEEVEVEQTAGERTPDTGRYVPGSDMEDRFDKETLHVSWNTVYNPVEGLISLTEKGLCLKGAAASLDKDDYKTLLVRRQEHFDFEAEMQLSFAPEEGDEAGICIYMNNRHHYEAALTKQDGEKYLILRRQIGKLKAVEAKIPYEGTEVVLKLSGRRESYRFSYCADGKEFKELGSGESQYLSTEAGGCFTGNFIGLYATGNGKEAERAAYVRGFTYKAVRVQK